MNTHTIECPVCNEPIELELKPGSDTYATYAGDCPGCLRYAMLTAVRPWSQV